MAHYFAKGSLESLQRARVRLLEPYLGNHPKEEDTWHDLGKSVHGVPSITEYLRGKKPRGTLLAIRAFSEIQLRFVASLS